MVDLWQCLFPYVSHSRLPYIKSAADRKLQSPIRTLGPSNTAARTAPLKNKGSVRPARLRRRSTTGQRAPGGLHEFKKALKKHGLAVMVADRASWHRSNAVRDLVEEEGGTPGIALTPTCSPYRNVKGFGRSQAKIDECLSECFQGVGELERKLATVLNPGLSRSRDVLEGIQGGSAQVQRAPASGIVGILQMPDAAKQPIGCIFRRMRPPKARLRLSDIQIDTNGGTST